MRVAGGLGESLPSAPPPAPGTLWTIEVGTKAALRSGKPATGSEMVAGLVGEIATTPGRGPRVVESGARSRYRHWNGGSSFYLTPLAGLLTVKSCRQHWRNNMRRIDGAAVCPARLSPNQSSAKNRGSLLTKGQLCLKR